MQKTFITTALLTAGLLFGSLESPAQPKLISPQRQLAQKTETMLKLMADLFDQIPRDLAEIDPRLGRIAIYRIDADNAMFTPPVKAHFESQLMEVFSLMGEPKIVSLPEMNTLRVSSTDSSFSVINSLPSPDELWKAGRRLRVNGFVEGYVTYLEDRAMFLDLRLNRTGTNEVLWAKSYSAYVKGMNVPKPNPMRKSLNAGIEVFNIQFEAAADTALHQDFNNKLMQYTLSFGLYQFMTASSRVRYELRGGVSFLSQGAKLKNPNAFEGTNFYSLESGGGSFTKVTSFNFKALLSAALLQSKKNPAGDWLSVYMMVSRYFTKGVPDLTGIGMGIRSDLSPKLSVSAGFSMIFGSYFDSQKLKNTTTTYRTKIDGLQYEVMMLQYSF